MRFPRAPMVRASGIVLPMASTTLEPGKVTEIEAWPQVIYKVRRLVLRKSHPGVELVDLRIGNMCQTVTVTHGLALDRFMPDGKLEELRAIVDKLEARLVDAAVAGEILEAMRELTNNLGAVNTCQVGQRVTLVLFNGGREPVLFEGHFVGDVIAEEIGAEW